MAITLTVGTAYTFTKEQLWTELAPGGTYRSMDWSISGSGLPTGMAATAAVVSGTPTEAGSFVFGLSNVDGMGNPRPVQTIPVTVTGGTPSGPVGGELEAAVCRFLGRPDDDDTLALATAHVPIVTAYVNAYTRGRGFDQFGPRPDVEHVIVAASARLVVNPEQAKRVQVGDYSEQAATLEGFTLPELAVLHRYRRRAL